MLGTLAMSLTEVGAYITLLAYQWDAGSVPDGPAALSHICRCSSKEAAKAWGGIRAKFEQGEDGCWRNRRLEAEREKQAVYREQQSERGRASARKRWPHSGNQTSNQAVTEAQPKHATVTSRLPSRLQPEGNSSYSVLQTSVKKDPTLECASDLSHTRREHVGIHQRGAGIGAGVMVGSLPRDHIRHAFCGRVCVPDFIHGEFLPKLGGDADGRLMAFYAATLAKIPDDQDIGDEPPKFWRAHFAATFRTVAPTGHKNLTIEELMADD